MNRWLERHLRRTNHNTVGVVEDDDKATVFVKRKMPMAELELKVDDPQSPEWRKRDIVQPTIRTGFFKKKATEVVEIGEVYPQSPDRKKYRPVIGGCEIQPHQARHVGTAGLLVNYDEFRGRALVGWLKGFVNVIRRMGFQTTPRKAILTNSHVANENPKYPVNGVEINQPYEGTSIGKTLYSLPLGPRYDASLVELWADHLDAVIDIGSITDTRKTDQGEKVHKYGRTTGYTEGYVQYTGASITVNYGDDVGRVTFRDCIVCSRMSDSGDSGSAIIRKLDNRAVGLLFAGSKRATIAQPIEDVLEAMGARL